MDASREAVVLVHGIWMTGLDLVLLRHRIRRAGFEPWIFRYPSLRAPPEQNARRLAAFVETLGRDTVHYVGHSLGGVVILHRFAGAPDPRPGRVVLLGSPVRGSAAARALAAHRLTAPLLGRSVERGLLGDAPAWAAARDLGTLAGALPVGMGRFVAGLAGPHDGTVAVAETRIPNARDHVEVPTSHTGLVVSRRVAAQVVSFLRSGGFRHGEEQT